jgi:hypothetical protein
MKRSAVVRNSAAFLTLLFGMTPRISVANPQKFILGPEVLVSSNSDGGDLRCEPSAAIFKDTIVVTWNDSYGGRHGSATGTAVGWSISKDRGRTFQFGGYLPLAEGDFIGAGADSRLAVDQEGDFYLEILSWQKNSHHIQLYVMERDKAGHWRKLPEAMIYDQSKGEGADKPALGVSGRRVGVAYTELRKASGGVISLVLSNDGGDTWLKPIPLSANSARIKTSASIIMSGNEILVAWTEADSGNSFNASEVWFAVSQDGGKTFSTAAMAYRLKRPFLPPKAYGMALGQMASISNDVSLAIVKNASGRAVYSLSVIEGTDQGSAVLWMTYDAGAGKWSAPVRLNGVEDATEIFSSMAAAVGNPALLYYSRKDADRTITDVFLSVLSEAGRVERVQLNTASSDWATTKGDGKYAPIQRIYGDYITLASDGNALVAAWTDGRRGEPRIYARVIETR